MEESVNWAQDDPLTKEDGLVLLSELKKKLSDKEFKKRAQQFEQAERYIENVEGGIDAIKKKTFRNRKQRMCELISKFWRERHLSLYCYLFC